VKKIPLPPAHVERRSGSALLIVLGFLLLISALALAFFATTTTQRNAAKSYSDSGAVRHLANSALELVCAQIADATTGAQLASNGAPDPANPLAWASQPGMIRTFDTSGAAYRYHKLYSSDNMTVSAFTLADDLPPATWKNSPGVWTDLNAPVADTTGTLNYPILDPAALTTTSKVNATGFTINASTVGYTGGNASSSNNPAPMPVRWLYVLQNGTLVPGSGSGNTTTVTGATTANPIIGRIAYWADDETCKININTAAEGSYWDTPRFVGPNYSNVFSGGVPNSSVAQSYPDFSYAAYQPAQFEFQRYPGHPAQVALSAVFPQVTPQLAAGLTPRLVWGGSQNGTVWTGNSSINLSLAPRKPLYASLDEFQFAGNATTPRTANTIATSALTRSDLEAAKFFITATSRAPEVNLFNLPRIACWPVDSSLSANRTTAYDRLIAFCSSTLNSTSNSTARLPYYFSRNDSQSPTHDYSNIPRNQNLYSYLQRLTSNAIPGFGGNFLSKYPQDRDQILTCIFDYIRCTNLMDPALGGYPITTAAAANGVWPVTANQFVQARKTPTDSVSTHLLGSGQVMPIQIGNATTNTMGFGRFPSLKEIGMAFVCVGAGELPNTSSITNNATLTTYLTSNSTPTNDEVMKLISNIPSVGSYGIPLTAPSTSTMSSYLRSNPSEWNLIRAKWIASINAGLLKPLSTFASGINYFNPALNGTALAPDERRVQMVIMERLFSPMAGNAPLYPDIIIRLQGLGNLTISNATNIATGSLFSAPPTAAGWLLKVSSPYTFSTGGTNPLNAQSLFKNNWSTHTIATASGNRTSTTIYPYYPFISQPFTVNSTTMSFSGASITHTMFQGRASYDAQNSRLDNAFKSSSTLTMNAVVSDSQNLAQNATITFPSGNFPTPNFPIYSTSNIYPRGGNATTDFYWQVGDWLKQAQEVDKTPSDIMSYATIRSLTYNGDGRVAALTRDIPATAFTTYSDYNTANSSGTNNLYHVSSGYTNTFMRIGGNSSSTYNTRQLAPGDSVTTGDFDLLARIAPGPFVNKPDEGDSTSSNSTRCPYLDVDQNASNTSIYTPNRIMPSPGMFGSLPTGAKAGNHWQTLLFRPQPGHPQSKQTRSSQPSDHLLMDLFWMPVVEPYAISEPFSTAGKVNMNYQILPFTYINRPTALMAAMKTEMLTTVPSATAPSSTTEEIPNDNPVSAASPWRRSLNLSEANGTLRQFREKFAAGDVFRSASEICDIYLTPGNLTWSNNAAGDIFWSGQQNTADNLREKPYTNLYARLTTKSNTFTVHIRAQALRKTPGAAPDQWAEGTNRIVGEERSAVTIERYIDVDSILPDFATDSTVILSKYNRIRTLSTRRFNP